MGFFNAAFRLGAIQGFQDRQEEIADQKEKFLKEDKKLATKAAATMANVMAKRKQRRQNRENIFAITKSIAPEGADEKAIKNLLLQKENTDGSPINEDRATRLLRSMTVDQINAFMPAEEPATESPPETEEEESGLGILGAIFSPSARYSDAQRRLFKKPPGVSDADWKAALAEQNIPVYEKPSQPVRAPQYTTGTDRNYINDVMTLKKEKAEDEERFKNLWTNIKTWMTGGTVYDTYYRKDIDRLVADVDDLDEFLRTRKENKAGTDRLTPKEIEKIKKIGIQEFLKDAKVDAVPAAVPPAAVPPAAVPPAAGAPAAGAGKVSKGTTMKNPRVSPYSPPPIT
jgi:hypothetical protein